MNTHSIHYSDTGTDGEQEGYYVSRKYLVVTIIIIVIIITKIIRKLRTESGKNMRSATKTRMRSETSACNGIRKRNKQDCEMGSVIGKRNGVGNGTGSRLARNGNGIRNGSAKGSETKTAMGPGKERDTGTGTETKPGTKSGHGRETKIK